MKATHHKFTAVETENGWLVTIEWTDANNMNMGIQVEQFIEPDLKHVYDRMVQCKRETEKCPLAS
jgi:hypothetical protein